MDIEEKEIDLRDYLRVITKRRHTIITFFIVVFSLVVLVTFSTAPVYMATTKVLIEKSDPTQLTPGAYYNAYDPEFYATQYQIITSAAVAKKVVDLLTLDKTFESYFPDKSDSFSIFGWFQKGVSKVLSFVFRTDEAKKLLTDEEKEEEKKTRIAKIIIDGISTKPVKNSKVVDVSFTSSNPSFATVVANTVAKAYIETLLDLNMSATAYTLDWMTRKADEEKAKIEQSEKALQSFAKSQNLVTVENKVAIIPQNMAEINSELVRAESKKRETEAMYNKIKEVMNSKNGNPETIAIIASDPTVLALRQQILKTEQDVTELSQKYGQKHPLMVKAVEDVKLLKAKREQEIRRVIDSVKNDYDLAKTNLTGLQRKLAEAKGEALSVNEKYMEYGILSREVETNRQLYDSLVKRVKEQSITEQVQRVNVLVVENAERPISPIKPKKVINLLLGIIVGLFGGVGMAFLVEYLDHTVKSPEDAEAKLGIPVLGMIPLQDISEKPIEKKVLNEPNSIIAENYKAIRTALLLSSAERPPKRILVTSSGPSEGKTATSVNLAIAIAQMQHSVLLIDADLRRPRIHKIFGLDNSKGLSTYLAGASDNKIAQAGPLPNFNVIPSGPIPPNPSELLGSHMMSDLISAVSEKYDFIIVDSPPLLSVADALILDNILDGTLIVSRAGKTSYDDVRKGLRALTNLRAQVFGLIINALDVKKNDYYYYYRYHNYYYSSDKTTEKQKKKN